MNRYTVEMSPRPTYPDAIQDATLGKAASFHSQYLSDHPEKATDPVVQLMFEDLKDGAFWRVIGAIDGRNRERTLGVLLGQTDGRYDPAETAKAQEWSHENFTPQELKTVLDIVVDTALLVPRRTPWPGTYMGHTTLYNEFVKKPDSQFKDQVSEDFRKRLNNGRFWENLFDMRTNLNGGVAIERVNEVLTKSNGDLDPNFAPEGLAILYRNKTPDLDFDLNGLSAKAIDNYISFVAKISEQKETLGITREQLDPLVAAYLETVISTTGDFKDPRYPLDRSRNFAVRLRSSQVVEYLEGSDTVRNRVAKKLKLMLDYGNKDHALQVLGYIPNPEDMRDRIGSPSYSLTF